ncbi:hypothetical protein, partial [Rheinheimera oceanensis]|uniref:hypothetical protein n=1 Tax=Rheinheimera oceanensis TaxID=2817449 RepID=UPI001BFE0C84
RSGHKKRGLHWTAYAALRQPISKALCVSNYRNLDVVMEVLKKIFENKNLLKAAVFLLHLSVILQLMQKTKIYYQMFSMNIRISDYFYVSMNIIIGFVAAYIVVLYFRRALTDNFYYNIQWDRKWIARGFAVLMLLVGYAAAQESLNDVLKFFGFFRVFVNFPFWAFYEVSGIFPFSYLAIPLVLICHLTHKNGKEEPSTLKA